MVRGNHAIAVEVVIASHCSPLYLRCCRSQCHSSDSLCHLVKATKPGFAWRWPKQKHTYLSLGTAGQMMAFGRELEWKGEDRHSSSLQPVHQNLKDPATPPLNTAEAVCCDPSSSRPLLQKPNSSSHLLECRVRHLKQQITPLPDPAVEE